MFSLLLVGQRSHRDAAAATFGISCSSTETFGKCQDTSRVVSGANSFRGASSQCCVSHYILWFYFIFLGHSSGFALMA